MAAYYVVSEALANAAKHAQASAVQVTVETQDVLLVLAVSDDGVGGADPGRGSGLLGLRDRVEAIGGRIEIASAPSQDLPAGDHPGRAIRTRLNVATDGFRFAGPLRRSWRS